MEAGHSQKYLIKKYLLGEIFQWIFCKILPRNYPPHTKIQRITKSTEIKRQKDAASQNWQRITKVDRKKRRSITKLTAHHKVALIYVFTTFGKVHFSQIKNINRRLKYAFTTFEKIHFSQIKNINEALIYDLCIYHFKKIHFSQSQKYKWVFNWCIYQFEKIFFLQNQKYKWVFDLCIYQISKSTFLTNQK